VSEIEPRMHEECTKCRGEQPESEPNQTVTDGGRGFNIGWSADPRMVHFRVLSQPEQAGAIRRLAAAGHSAHAIASATGLSVEQVRQVLAEEARL
jgi:hypothetical protein